MASSGAAIDDYLQELSIGSAVNGRAIAYEATLRLRCFLQPVHANQSSTNARRQNNLRDRRMNAQTKSICAEAFDNRRTRQELIEENLYCAQNLDSAFIDFALDVKSSDPKYYKVSNGSRNPQQEAKEFSEMLLKINPEWRGLTHHPGIVQCRELFLEFIKSGQYASQSPSAILKQFRDFMGFKIVYRGMPIRKSDFKALSNSDIKSTSIKSNLLDLKVSQPSYYRQVINRETMSNKAGDNLISVTDYDWFARIMGASSGDPSIHDAVLVYKIKIPIIDVIDVGREGLFQLDMFSGQRWAGGNLYFGKHVQVPFDAKIESFVQYSILNSEIVDVQLYADDPIGKLSGFDVIAPQSATTN